MSLNKLIVDRNGCLAGRWGVRTPEPSWVPARACASLSPAVDEAMRAPGVRNRLARITLLSMPEPPPVSKPGWNSRGRNEAVAALQAEPRYWTVVRNVWLFSFFPVACGLLVLIVDIAAGRAGVVGHVVATVVGAIPTIGFSTLVYVTRSLGKLRDDLRTPPMSLVQAMRIVIADVLSTRGIRPDVGQ